MAHLTQDPRDSEIDDCLAGLEHAARAAGTIEGLREALDFSVIRRRLRYYQSSLRDRRAEIDGLEDELSTCVCSRPGYD